MPSVGRDSRIRQVVRTCEQDQWHFQATDANYRILHETIASALYVANFAKLVGDALTLSIGD